jgi:multiple sugar transport system substrate-binding protein
MEEVMKKIIMLIWIVMLLFSFSAFMIFAGEEKEAAEGTVIKVLVSGALAMDSLEPLTREFEEANPDIKVELSIVSWSVLLNQIPIILSTGRYEYDVIDTYDPWIDEFGDTGAVVDLNEYMSEEAKQLDPELLALSVVGDTLSAFPYLPSFYLMFYNKELIAEVGLDPNKPPRTIDEFYKWAKKSALDYDGDGKVDRYALAFNFTIDWGNNFLQTLYKGYGGEPFEIVNGKVHITYDTTEMLETIRFLKKLYDEGIVDPGLFTGGSPEITAKFENNEIPIKITHDMHASSLSPGMLSKTGIIAFPGKVRGTYGSIHGVEYLAIPSSSPNVEAAAKYLKYICSPEKMSWKTYKNYVPPAYTKNWNDPQLFEDIPWFKEVKKAKDNMVPMSFPIKENNKLYFYTIEQAHKCLLGEITPEEFVKNIQSEADKYETLDVAVEREVFQKYAK